MSRTKLELVQEAFAEIAIAGYDFDLQGDEINSALNRMDAMFSSWERQYGIRVGYNIPGSPHSTDINGPSGVSDDAFEAAYTNLAIRIAPLFGKTPTRETKQVAKDGLNALISRATSNPPRMQMPANMPAGAGNRWFRGIDQPFLVPPVDELQTGPDAQLDFL